MCDRCLLPRAYCAACGQVARLLDDGTVGAHEQATTDRPKPRRRRRRAGEWRFGWQITDGLWGVECPGGGQPSGGDAP